MLDRALYAAPGPSVDDAVTAARGIVPADVTVTGEPDEGGRVALDLYSPRTDLDGDVFVAAVAQRLANALGVQVVTDDHLDDLSSSPGL